MSLLRANAPSFARAGLTADGQLPVAVDPATQGSAFSRGLRNGVDGVISGGANLVGGVMDTVAGPNAGDGARSVSAALGPKMQARMRGLPTRVEDAFEQGRMGDWAAYTLGQSVPSMGMALAGGAAGRGLLRSAPVTGALIGASAANAPQMVGDAYQTLHDDQSLTDMSAGEKLARAGATGLAQSALEALPEVGVLSRLGLAGARGAGRGLVRGTLQTGAEEAATEVGQELAGKYAHQLANPNVTLADAGDMSDYLNAAAGGFVGGGAMGGVSGAAESGMDLVDGTVRTVKDGLAAGDTALRSAAAATKATVQGGMTTALNTADDVSGGALRRAGQYASDAYQYGKAAVTGVAGGVADSDLAADGAAWYKKHFADKEQATVSPQALGARLRDYTTRGLNATSDAGKATFDYAGAAIDGFKDGYESSGAKQLAESALDDLRNGKTLSPAHARQATAWLTHAALNSTLNTGRTAHTAGRATLSELAATEVGRKVSAAVNAVAKEAEVFLTGTPDQAAIDEWVRSKVAALGGAADTALHTGEATWQATSAALELALNAAAGANPARAAAYHTIRAMRQARDYLRSQNAPAAAGVEQSIAAAVQPGADVQATAQQLDGALRAQGYTDAAAFVTEAMQGMGSSTAAGQAAGQALAQDDISDISASFRSRPSAPTAPTFSAADVDAVNAKPAPGALKADLSAEFGQLADAYDPDTKGGAAVLALLHARLFPDGINPDHSEEGVATAERLGKALAGMDADAMAQQGFKLSRRPTGLNEQARAIDAYEGLIRRYLPHNEREQYSPQDLAVIRNVISDYMSFGPKSNAGARDHRATERVFKKAMLALFGNEARVNSVMERWGRVEGFEYQGGSLADLRDEQDLADREGATLAAADFAENDASGYFREQDRAAISAPEAKTSYPMRRERFDPDNQRGKDDAASSDYADILNAARSEFGGDTATTTVREVPALAYLRGLPAQQRTKTMTKWRKEVMQEPYMQEQYAAFGEGLDESEFLDQYIDNYENRERVGKDNRPYTFGEGAFWNSRYMVVVEPRYGEADGMTDAEFASLSPEKKTTDSGKRVTQESRDHKNFSVVLKNADGEAGRSMQINPAMLTKLAKQRAGGTGYGAETPQQVLAWFAEGLSTLMDDRRVHSIGSAEGRSITVSDAPTEGSPLAKALNIKTVDADGKDISPVVWFREQGGKQVAVTYQQLLDEVRSGNAARYGDPRLDELVSRERVKAIRDGAGSAEAAAAAVLADRQARVDEFRLEMGDGKYARFADLRDATGAVPVLRNGEVVAHVAAEQVLQHGRNSYYAMVLPEVAQPSGAERAATDAWYRAQLQPLTVKGPMAFMSAVDDVVVFVTKAGYPVTYGRLSAAHYTGEPIRYTAGNNQRLELDPRELLEHPKVRGRFEEVQRLRRQAERDEGALLADAYSDGAASIQEMQEDARPDSMGWSKLSEQEGKYTRTGLGIDESAKEVPGTVRNKVVQPERTGVPLDNVRLPNNYAMRQGNGRAGEDPTRQYVDLDSPDTVIDGVNAGKEARRAIRAAKQPGARLEPVDGTEGPAPARPTDRSQAQPRATAATNAPGAPAPKLSLGKGVDPSLQRMADRLEAAWNGDGDLHTAEQNKTRPAAYLTGRAADERAAKVAGLLEEMSAEGVSKEAFKQMLSRNMRFSGIAVVEQGVQDAIAKREAAGRKPGVRLKSYLAALKEFSAGK